MGLRKGHSRSGAAMALGVLSTFWLSTVPFILTPAMNRLGEHYSTVPYSQVLMLSTVVALMVVPFSLLSGAVVGRKVGYRPMLLASILLMLDLKGIAASSGSACTTFEGRHRSPFARTAFRTPSARFRTLCTQFARRRK